MVAQVFDVAENAFHVILGLATYEYIQTNPIMVIKKTGDRKSLVERN